MMDERLKKVIRLIKVIKKELGVKVSPAPEENLSPKSFGGRFAEAILEGEFLGLTSLFVEGVFLELKVDYRVPSVEEKVLGIFKENKIPFLAKIDDPIREMEIFIPFPENYSFERLCAKNLVRTKMIAKKIFKSNYSLAVSQINYLRSLPEEPFFDNLRELYSLITYVEVRPDLKGSISFYYDEDKADVFNFLKSQINLIKDLKLSPVRFRFVKSHGISFPDREFESRIWIKFGPEGPKEGLSWKEIKEKLSEIPEEIFAYLPEFQIDISEEKGLFLRVKNDDDIWNSLGKDAQKYFLEVLRRKAILISFIQDPKKLKDLPQDLIDKLSSFLGVIDQI